jgi:hypothetical protein
MLAKGGPLIGHDAPAILAPGELGAIDVFAASSQGVDRVVIHHRENAQDPFKTVELAYLGGSHYRWILTAPGHVGVIEYYVEVHDRSGNVTFSPANGTFHIQIQEPESGALLPGVFGLAGAAGAVGTAVYVVRRRRRTKSSLDDRAEDKL